MEFISALLGLLIGIAGTWIAHRNRLSPQREILYSKQVDVYTNVLRQAQGVYSFALIYMKATKEDKAEVQGDILRDYMKFLENTAEIGSVAPTGVYVAYADFSTLLGGATNPHDPNYGKATQTDFIKAYYQLLNAMRRSMGIDSLTEESMGLFKKPSDTIEYLDMEPFHDELKTS